ncbi:MAG: hypothetical protein K6T61_06685 [Bryobacteraceae bacterium]|nr:hypothetical protein [Bryobacteraceae bacterium]
MSQPAGRVVAWSAVTLSLFLGPSAGAIPLDRIRPADSQAASVAPYRVFPQLSVLDVLASLPGTAAVKGEAGHAVPLHAVHGLPGGNPPRTYVASWPGAEIALMELAECAGRACDSVEITFAEEPPLRTTRIEGLVKFQPPAADRSADGSDFAALRWLDWLDNLTEDKSGAGYPSLVLGASGLLGIWLARIKRLRSM